MSINYLKEVDDPITKEKALKSSLITISISGEDHTLGNLLRSRLSQMPEVEFASYSIPHPSLSEMNFRLQVNEGLVALDVFKQALDDLIYLSKGISKEFNEKYGQFDTTMADTTTAD
ncbi:putative DNA-directed RNA polymerase subunit [Gregarina niphandrodes]|uniref:DNA-directed RNA polymerase subunit n=1 Tax=Gregarina niphandrodes TaxID=110365 RepID=A0A023B691_GRENI|nr:putative DNA-directed RNA polymerase subunit [Gregarina niphandrodes]EZG65877.1 putative DNA-directed RNA polymerase subunit [Gregarina niphandrodes]|eukprot:XP_011134035.1 putative DNA-directed RNA polymerase subunit [Gregarina niphandrodes]